MENQLNILKRPRRNRKSPAIRELVKENILSPQKLVMPYFLTEGAQIRAPISSLPNQFHLSLDNILSEVEQLTELGINSLMLFPIISPKYKSAKGKFCLNKANPIIVAVQEIKKRFPEICIMADIALDPFTTHGHDGIISNQNEILNDETVKVLSTMALVYAQSGIDVLAPSDMMDGRVKAIRRTLDDAGYINTSIMSYCAKYASSFYAPFRDALKSRPSFGDKKTYQMDPANSKEALIEAKLDEEEGADFLMVKPASLYLDIIKSFKENTNLPVVAYHVSGEYAMLKAAAQNKWLDFLPALHETLLSIKRAGADIIISYGAKEIANYLQ